MTLIRIKINLPESLLLLMSSVHQELSTGLHVVIPVLVSIKDCFQIEILSQLVTESLYDQSLWWGNERNSNVMLVLQPSFSECMMQLCVWHSSLCSGTDLMLNPPNQKNTLNCADSEMVLVPDGSSAALWANATWTQIKSSGLVIPHKIGMPMLCPGQSDWLIVLGQLLVHEFGFKVGLCYSFSGTCRHIIRQISMKIWRRDNIS